MKATCIMCPMGCPLEIESTDTCIVVKGNTCKRGEVYGKQEFVNPMRSFTSLLFTKDGRVVPIKTTGLIPKNKLHEVAQYTKKLRVDNDAKIGDIVEKNILNLNVDFVITGSLIR